MVRGTAPIDLYLSVLFCCPINRTSRCYYKIRRGESNSSKEVNDVYEATDILVTEKEAN